MPRTALGQSWLAVGWVAAFMVHSSELPALAPERPGLLFGGGPAEKKLEASVDPRLPTGPRVQYEPRPTALVSSACSLREPVCVHATSRAQLDVLPRYLEALEDARSMLVGALGLPAPLPDGLGPSPGLDLYLLAAGDRDLDVVADPRWLGTDRTSAYCRVRPSTAEYRRQAASCVAEAVLYGLDAAETPYLRRALATYLWNTVGGSTAADLDAVDRWQANPQLAPLGGELAPESAGAAELFHYVDRRLGAGRPGALPVALFQLARSDTAAGQERWHNEPDTLDVLRRAFADSKESFEDFWLNFAVARAFWGSRDNGAGDPALGWLGDAGRVRFDWTLKASSLPRRLAARRPLEPLGSAYLWLDLDRVSVTATLAFRANWEAPALFRWTLVAVDARGSAIKRYDLPFVQGATSAERTLLDYQNAVGLLIVGTSVGGVDLGHPIDPDHEPFEPHGFTVYLAEL